MSCPIFSLDKKYEAFLNLVVYELYPRSFQDSNGYGISDYRDILIYKSA